VTTDEAALVLHAERSAATHTLRRLAIAGLLKRVRHGLWATDLNLDPLLLPEYLTAPFPSYISLQSALFFHGMVSQIPNVIYVASLARTRKVRTSVGTFSIHRLASSFFGGYEIVKTSGVHLATPEKALLDTLYLAPAHSRLFAHLREVELPERFDRDRVRYWVRRIPAGAPDVSRTAVGRRTPGPATSTRPTCQTSAGASAQVRVDASLPAE
jgi:predicted transcriptional regulator of viral defense system